MTGIVILSGTRTPIGTFGGTLSGFAPIDLATHVSKEAISRAGVSADKIGQVVFGHIINTEPRDMYLSRVAAVNAGVPVGTPAMNVNRLCGSGVQAVISAAQMLMTGDADFALAGGAEVMSKSPYILPAARFGQKMGDAKMLDMMTGALSCPFGTGHMGVTAENVAAECSISREEQDAFAMESQERAAKAISEGHFKEEIVPVEITTRKGTTVFDTDEHPKQTSLEKLGNTPWRERIAGVVAGVEEAAAGVRRGTRKRMKPLEFFRGERVVYGRRESGRFPCPVDVITLQT